MFQQGLATVKIANVLAERCDKHSVFQLLEIHKHINTKIQKKQIQDDTKPQTRQAPFHFAMEINMCLNAESHNNVIIQMQKYPKRKHVNQQK